MKILCIEDDWSFAEALKGLRSLNVEVEIAWSRYGIEDLNKEGFFADIAIVDIALPGEDMTKVIELLHKIYPGIRIIIYTGWLLPFVYRKVGAPMDVESVEELLSYLKVHRFVVKRLNIDNLISAVKEQIEILEKQTR